MKKVLLVGGAGFMGSYITKQLLSKGITPVIFDSFSQYLPSLVIEENKVNSLRRRFGGILEEVAVIRGNAVSYGEIRRALEDNRPDAVIHLGGVPLSNLSNIYLEEALDGVKATGNIIQAIHDLKLNARFIYTSSSTIYGDFKYDPADEDHPKNPKGVYAGVKLAGEFITSSFCKQFAIPYVILRPQAVYGPTDINRRVVQIFIEDAIAGKEIIVKDPTNAVDFTFVEDTASGFVLAVIKKEAENQIFNISFGTGRTLGELAEIIKIYFPDVKIKLAEADPALPRRGSFDISRAKKLLGYEPKYPLEKGIAEYIKYYKKND